MEENHAVGLSKPTKKARVGKSLKVLIVGGRTALDKTHEILEWLTPMGFDFELIGVVCRGRNCPSNPDDPELGFRVFRDYRKVIREMVPDVVVVAGRSRKLFKDLVEIVPDTTRLLDWFALEALQTLNRVSGQLGTTRNKLRRAQIVKEVLMAGTGISIMVIDEDFRVLDINNAILGRTHMSKSGCLGRTCHWVIHRTMEPCHLRGGGCPAVEVFRSGSSTHRLREELRENGAKRYFTISGYPLVDDEEGKKCVLMVWKDVTKGLAPVLDRQAKHMKSDFTQVLHQDKMVALGKLAAAAVHDINNPLQGILNFSKLMREMVNGGPLSATDLDKCRRYLDLIATESARCGQILKSLLSFARLGNLQKSAVLLGPLMDEIEMLVGNELQLQGIRLERDFPESAPAIFGDRNQIKQALLNLVLNSIEAQPNGGVIRVSSEPPENPNFVTIRVSDTGGGVPKSVEGSIFEPFVTTKEFGKGVGLGLSVVYGIVTQHDGTIEMQNNEGEGATFILSLPAFKKHLQKATTESRRGGEASS
ncbi:MAG: PAS domain-containing sensor histidine kinase [Thermodesulfobacteriota bacterium]